MTNADCRLALGVAKLELLLAKLALRIAYRYRYVYISIGNTIYDLPVCSLHMSHTGLFIFFNRLVQIFLESYVALTKQISKEIDGH